MRLALQLLTYNKPEVLGPLFDSLAAQTDRDWTLFVLDNSSDEIKAKEIAAFIDKEKTRLPIIFERAKSNTGFDGGHEYLYHQHEAAFVMCVNDDAVLNPDFISRLMQALEQNARLAAVGGKILRWDFDAQGNVVKSDVIDSLGLARTRYHKVYDISAGQSDTPSLSHSIVSSYPVFGVSGCLPIYRRAAVGQQLFDPSYFMYKEDVEISYRFARAGWQVMTIPVAVAYHRRTFREEVRRSAVPWRIQWYSYRNHLRNLRKHLTLKDWLRDGWLVLPYECAKTLYLLVMHRGKFIRAVCTGKV